MDNQYPYIFQVVEAYGGGVFTSVTQICNELVQRGYRVRLLFARRPETPRDIFQFLDRAVEAAELPMVRDISPKADLKALISLIAEVRRFRPRVVHAHSSKAGVLCRIAAMAFRTRMQVYYSPRGLSFLREDVSPVRRQLYLWLERVAAHFGGTVIACSTSELERVRADVKTDRVVLIENAVSSSKIPHREGELRPPLIIGTLGRISAQKNPRLFVDISRELQSRDVRLVWIGGGDDEDIIHRMRESGITVTGWIDREAALEKVSTFAVYLQTSLWEGMPLALIESALAGVPAVVTNIVGNRDVVCDGETGFVCDSLAEMVTAVDRLLDDRELNDRMGAAARSRALTRFSVSRMTDELLSAYHLPTRKTNRSTPLHD